MQNRKINKVSKILAKKNVYRDISPESLRHNFYYSLLQSYSMPYETSLRSAFVDSFNSINDFIFYDHIMIRDGALGLFNFFSRFQTPPKRCQTLFIINASLAFIVPLAWKKNCLYCNLQTRSSSIHYNFVSSDSRKLGLRIDLIEDCFDFEKAVKVLINEAKKYDEIFIITKFVDSNSFIFDDWNGDDWFIGCNKILSRLIAICEKQKLNFKIISLEEVLALNNLYMVDIIDCTKLLLVSSDDYFTYHLLSKGARYLDHASTLYSTDHSLDIELSPYHQLSLISNAKLDSLSLFSQILIKCKVANSRDANYKIQKTMRNVLEFIKTTNKI